jgi:hypothetical protein
VSRREDRPGAAGPAWPAPLAAWSPQRKRLARSPNLQRAQDPNLHAKSLAPARHPGQRERTGRTFKTFQSAFKSPSAVTGSLILSAAVAKTRESGYDKAHLEGQKRRREHERPALRAEPDAGRETSQRRARTGRPYAAGPWRSPAAPPPGVDGPLGGR